MADLFKSKYYLIQETPFGIINRYKNQSPMESLIIPKSPILQIIINGGLLGFSMLFIKIKNILGLKSKSANVYFITILSMGL